MQELCFLIAMKEVEFIDGRKPTVFFHLNLKPFNRFFLAPKPLHQLLICGTYNDFYSMINMYYLWD